MAVSQQLAAGESRGGGIAPSRSLCHHTKNLVVVSWGFRSSGTKNNGKSNLRLLVNRRQLLLPFTLSQSSENSYQRWIDKIKETVITQLFPALSKSGMTISEAEFKASNPGDTPYNLANIFDFNPLIAQS